MRNKHIGSTWEDLKTRLSTEGALTEDDIRESQIRVAIMGELIKARHEKNISQRELEAMSGVRQPIIARMETGASTPNLNTVMRVLAPLGMTLAVVPIEGRK